MKTYALSFLSLVGLFATHLTFANGYTETRDHPLVRYIYKQISDSEFLAQAATGKLVVYDYKRLAVVREMQVPFPFVRNHTAVTASDDGTIGIVGNPYQIHIFDIATGENKTTLDYRTQTTPQGVDGYWKAFVTRDNKRAFLLGNFNDIVVLNLETNEIVWSERRKDADFHRVQESPDGRFVFLGSSLGKSFLLYDRQTDRGETIFNGDRPGAEDLYSGTFDGTSEALVFYNRFHTLIRYDIVAKTFLPIQPELTRITRIYASPDNHYLVLERAESYPSNDKDVRMFLLEAKTLQRIRLSVPREDFQPYLSTAVWTARNSFVFRAGATVYEMSFETLRWKMFQLPDDFDVILHPTRDCASILGNTPQFAPKVTEAYPPARP